MLHAGLDLSRRRIDVCLLSAVGEIVEEFASPPDGDGLLGLARRVGRHQRPVRAVIESMTGARFVHDRLEALGWDVLIADAAKVKGLAPLACKTDKIDARVLAVLLLAVGCEQQDGERDRLDRDQLGPPVEYGRPRAAAPTDVPAIQPLSPSAPPAAKGPPMTVALLSPSASQTATLAALDVSATAYAPRPSSVTAMKIQSPLLSWPP